MSSHLAQALDALCAAHGTTLTAVAARANMSQSTLSRACAGRRLEERTLRDLFASQPDRRDGLDILVAHLRDEVVRTGVGDHEVKISTDGRELEPDMRLLAHEAQTDETLRGLLGDLAALCRARPIATYKETPETLALAGEREGELEEQAEVNRLLAEERRRKEEQEAKALPASTPAAKPKRGARGQ